jgi:hypothetical protein
MAFERLPLPDRGYLLTSPAGVVPWLGADLQPTVILGKQFVIAAATTDLARAAIAAEARSGERWKPDGELLKSFEGLPKRLSFLHVGNTRDSRWPEGIANFPETAEPFLLSFMGLSPLVAEEAADTPDLLAILGVPLLARSTAQAERTKLPRADDIRAHLFPSVIAATVDERNFRVLALEAVPFACVGIEAKFEREGRGTTLNFGFNFAAGR